MKAICKSSALLLLSLFASGSCDAHAVVYESTVNGAVRSSVDYWILGIQHILPFGLDHLLFIAGLFLSSRKLKDLLLYATAFTIAHSLTLILSAVQIIAIDNEIIEPIIALSIAAVGVENVMQNGRKANKYFLIFIFGLIHGCGFAGALAETGIPENFFYSSLIAFNLGIETAQIGFILICFLLLKFVKDERKYRRLVVIPVSMLIFTIGITLTILRLHLL